MKIIGKTKGGYLADMSCSEMEDSLFLIESISKKEHVVLDSPKENRNIKLLEINDIIHFERITNKSKFLNEAWDELQSVTKTFKSAFTKIENALKKDYKYD
jgi:hypothetical protein